MFKKIDLNNIHKFCINLPDRNDRLDKFKESLVRIIPNGSFELIDGVINKIPRIGIWQAHQNCIALAKHLDLDCVLIMEDDLYIPSDRAAEFAMNAFSECPEDADILLGGIYTSAGLIPYNQFWQQTKEFSGLQFYIVFKKAYDIILNENKYIAHIDRWMANPKNGNLKCYVTNPFCAIQYDGYSDNTKKETNYNRFLLNKFNLLK